jgi:outer membrane protein assembly factor BamA
LSDALGNHRFYLVTDLYQDISNSEILFNYWYLPKRTDWALVLFQNFEYPAIYSNYIHIRRNRGLGVLGSYPFDKFTRLEFGTIGYLSYNEIYYRYSDDIWRYYVSPYNEHILLLDQAFVFDNTVWNDWGPVKGTRMRLEAYQSTPISSRKFYSTYLDFRNYIRISKRYSFATWLFGGSSFGPDQEQFSMGSEYVRGYEYQEFYDSPGSKLAFASFELRHPFIDQLKIAFPIPLQISDIRGVTFFDAGMVFNDSTVAYQRGKGFQDLKLGVGAGIRMQISYFLLKLDFAKPLSVTDNKHWKVYFSLGTDF